MVRASLFGAAFLVLLLAGSAGADVLTLKDGRFVDDRPLEKVEKGVKVKYENGDVFVSDDLILDWFGSDAAGDFVPRNDAEREQAAKGLAPWNGKWIPKERRARLLQDEDAKRKKRVEQSKARREWRDRAIVESKQFTFHHTLPDELFTEFQDLFETYYAVFTKEWGIKAPVRKKKPTINIYHDAEYFHQVSGAPQGVVGYYSPLDKDLHFYFDREFREFTIDVMFHEGNHMLTHFIDERMWYPAWINEGLAEYYGASTWDARTKTMKVGGLQSARMAVLWNEVEDEKKWQRLGDLIDTPRINAIQYSWAWSFCHFLMSTEKYKEPFRKLYLGFARDNKIPKRPFAFGMISVEPAEQKEAILRYLKVKSIDELEKEWHDYVKANLHLKRADVDYAGAGWIMSLYGERAKARKFFRKAIESGCVSPYVLATYAELQWARGKSELAREFAQKAIDVDPLHANARHLLGRIVFEEGDQPEGERLMKLGMELAPEDSRLWYLTEVTKQGKKPPAGSIEEGGGDGESKDGN